MKKHRIVGWKQRAKALSRSLLGASVLLAMLALGFAYRAPSMANAAALGVSNDISPAADTWVASGQPDANLFGAEQRWVGYDQAGGYQAERTFIAFGAFGLPSGSVITSASLQLYLSAWTSGDPLMTVSAYRVRTAWSDTLTWNQAKSLAVDAQPATSAPVASGQFGWYAWDVTAAAQDWLAHDDTPNLSFELRSDASEESGSQHERAFWSNECPPADCGSNRPQLVIQYQLPTPIPTATTATPTRTPSPTNTPTPTVTPTPTPGLQLTLRAAPSGPVREGQTITYTVGYQTSGQLDDVAINDQIPSGTYAITSSLRPPGTGGIALGNTVVIWELGEVYAGKGPVSLCRSRRRCHWRHRPALFRRSFRLSCRRQAMLPQGRRPLLPRQCPSRSGPTSLAHRRPAPGCPRQFRWWQLLRSPGWW